MSPAVMLFSGTWSWAKIIKGEAEQKQQKRKCKGKTFILTEQEEKRRKKSAKNKDGTCRNSKVYLFIPQTVILNLLFSDILKMNRPWF